MVNDSLLIRETRNDNRWFITGVNSINLSIRGVFTRYASEATTVGENGCPETSNVSHALMTCKINGHLLFSS